MSGSTWPGRLTSPSNRLIVGPDFGVFAQDRVDRLEHRAHARFRNWALDDDDELWLVGGRAHEPPGAVLDSDPDAVDGHKVANWLAGQHLASRLHGLEPLDDPIRDRVFDLIRAVRGHCRRRPSLRQIAIEIGHRLFGVP